MSLLSLSNKGRIDCVVHTDNTIYVIEFKLNDSCQAALEQIEDKQYAQKYLFGDKAITLIGVAFDQQTRNIGDYVEKSLIK
jgi:ATP-dependent exoDNAse (exonuclease V) beta subunit